LLPVFERGGRQGEDVRDRLVEDERLVELDTGDRTPLRAEPARPDDLLAVERRDRRGDLGARGNGDLRSPN
jgi:hypothetical protein